MSIKKNHNEDEWKDKYDYQILINYNHIPKRWNISFNSKKKKKKEKKKKKQQQQQEIEVKIESKSE